MTISNSCICDCVLNSFICPVETLELHFPSVVDEEEEREWHQSIANGLLHVPVHAGKHARAVNVLLLVTKTAVIQNSGGGRPSEYSLPFKRTLDETIERIRVALQDVVVVVPVAQAKQRNKRSTYQRTYLKHKFLLRKIPP